MRILFLLFLGIGTVLAAPMEPLWAQASSEVPWSGQGSYRLLVEVVARDLEGRSSDEIPAELAIDFAELKRLNHDRLPDVASIRVMKYEPASGQPTKYSQYAYARSEYDRPFRWHDAAIPYEFPDFRDAVSRTKGKIVRKTRARGGSFYNVLGDWQAGRLVWTHTQVGEDASTYAIYFDLLPTGEQPNRIPPRSWIGDGTPRCDQQGSSTMGADHCRVELADWNDDGLIDLIVGEHYGHVLWWPNLGTKEEPMFRYGKFVLADAMPLDAGMAAAPKVVDWDGDGVLDLLVGTHWNRILFYKNAGSNRERRLVYQGILEIDGQPLELPIRPLTRGRPDIFKRDYYPVLETVDWDDDGDVDLLAGGYVTGMVFFYENTSQLPNGTPRLRLRGPLTADGKALNVGHWCAAPCLADFDGDGDLDLISGNMPMYLQADERTDHERDYLQYFENVGTRSQPEFRARDFPSTGRFQRDRLATPRAADWDGDGDLDLVVSARQNVYLFKNTGTADAARFELHHDPLVCEWGLAAIGAARFVDWDSDGDLDLVERYNVRLNSGVGNPFMWDKAHHVLPPGEYIEHPSGIGDDWFWPYLTDFDRDGKIDVLFGTWHGNVWFHRNLTSPQRSHFDVEGFRLRLVHGEPIKVGPIAKDVNTDFDALQGSRTVFTAADFDGDDRLDLVIGDTYGKVRYFRNVAASTIGADEPRFADPIEVGDLGIRGLVDTTDWNQDGRPDVIAGAANGKVRVFLNNKPGSETPFAAGFDPKLPLIEQPRVVVADINSDGDDDLFLPSTQGSCFVERSFLSAGYATAKLLEFEKKPGAGSATKD